MSKGKSIGSSAKETLMSKIDGNRRFKFSTDSMNGSNLLIKAPVITVIICLIVTGFFLGHSGFNDCRDGYEPSWCSDESSMNVTGDLEVYLPLGSDVIQNLYRV